MNGSNESEIREMRKNWRYLQNVYAKMHVLHVALCVCRGTMRVPDSHNIKYDILKHAQEQSMRTCMNIPTITLRIDKYGDIGLLLIQLSHISVSADCKDYCSISRP